MAVIPIRPATSESVRATIMLRAPAIASKADFWNRTIATLT